MLQRSMLPLWQMVYDARDMQSPDIIIKLGDGSGLEHVVPSGAAGEDSGDPGDDEADDDLGDDSGATEAPKRRRASPAVGAATGRPKRRR